MPKKTTTPKTDPYANFYKKGERGAPPAQPDTNNTKGASLQANRQGKRAINAYVSPAAFREIKLLIADLGISQQDFLKEAINDKLLKHDRSPLA